MRLGSLLALSTLVALAGQAQAAPERARTLTIEEILNGRAIAFGPTMVSHDVAARAQPPHPADSEPPPTIDDILEGRRIPGRVKELPPAVVQDNPGAVHAPPPEAFPQDQTPLPDRWRLAGALGLTNPRWYDPYNQNFLKGDIPIKGTHDWFFAFTGISDTVIEPRSFPIPVGVQTTERPGSLDAFGGDTSLMLAQTFIAAASVIKGSTAYKPPELEFRVALA
ncbi:MAG TPA: hypothetical protein VF474_00975, partial [Phenylobacterium sp.]